MVANIYYLFSTILLVLYCLLLPNYQKALSSIEWLIVYRQRNLEPDTKRVDYKLVGYWTMMSILSTVWLLSGIFIENSQIFIFLSVINFLANYLIAVNRGSLKIKLAFMKSIVFNLILLFFICNWITNLPSVKQFLEQLF